MDNKNTDLHVGRDQKLLPHMRTMQELNEMPGRELEGKRTETAKFFALGENLYQAVVGDSPVHAQDRLTGKWLDIDNTLESRGDAQGQTGVENRSNQRLKARMEPADADWTVLLTNDEGKTITWRLEGAEANAVLQRQKIPKRGVAPRTQEMMEQMESEAIYADIMPSVDMRCRLVSDTFKEEIIFKDRSAAKPLSFLLQAEGLALQLLDDASIKVMHESKPAFVLPSPFMVDSAGEIGDVGVALKALGGDQWRLAYTPDIAWLEKATFPVTLDPTVKTTDITTTAVKRNLVSSAEPAKVFANMTSAKLEDVPASNKRVMGFFRFEQVLLPKIDASYYVTDATLTLTSSVRANTLYLHEILEDWNPGTLTYNSRPATHEMCSDALTNKAPASTLNITNLVRKWYEGTNYGFALQLKAETATANINTTVSDLSLTINYVSLAGLTDHLAYESHSVGRAGTAHVGLYNGNLVMAHGDTATSGLRMPVSVSHYYNSCYSKLDTYKMGLGWRHSLQVTLHKETLKGSTGNFYVLTDGSGTRHHFALRSGSIYDDMSGLFMTLTLSGTTAKIEDKGNNVMEFTTPTVVSDGTDGNYKLMKSLTNAQGDKITVTADANNQIQSVTDGAGRTTTFVYDAGGRLKEVFAPDMQEQSVRFYYDVAGQLIRILHEDETEALYAYDAQGRLVEIDNHGRQLAIAYNEAGPGRVAEVFEHHEEMAGNRRLYLYGDSMTTVIDGTVENGKKLIHHFNDYGNVISTNDMMGNAFFVKYSGTAPMHRPEIVSKTQRAVTNLLRNHSFEKDGGWDFYCSAKIVDSDARIGTRSLCFTNPPEGGFQYVAQDLKIAKGKKYTLSFYAKKFGEMELWAAYQYKNALGRLKTVKSPKMQGDLTAEYNRCVYTFSVPEDARQDSIKVLVCGNGEFGETGKIFVDTVQLEQGDVPNQYNLLYNSDFAVLTDMNTPDGWILNTGSSASDIVKTVEQDAARPENISPYAMQLVGGTAKLAGFYQEINFGGLKDDVFVAGGWAKGYSLPRNTAKKKFNIRIAFKTTTTFADYKDEIGWSDEWSGWQFACGPVIAPADYSAVRFHIDYENNANQADFASLFLYKDEFGWTYTYDSLGNIVSVKDLTGKYKKATYDIYNNLTEYTPIGQADTVKVKMEYGTTVGQKKQHRLLKSTSPLGIERTFAYDNVGNQTLSKLLGADKKSFVQTEAQYSADKNHAWASFDARGQMTLAQRDSMTDLVSYIGNDGGVQTIFEYQDKKLVGAHVSTVDKTARNQYKYSEGLNDLIEIGHNTESETECDVSYSFEYDALGNQTKLRVGTRPLSEIVYTETGDKLPIRQEYGNGGKMHMEYDEYKRIKSIRYDDEEKPRYGYAFDAMGELAAVTDHALGRIKSVSKDLGNRPVRYTETEDDTNVYRLNVQYDGCNRVSKERESVGENYDAFYTTYAYDVENKPTEVKFGTDAAVMENNYEGSKITYGYDGLGRVKNRTQKGLETGAKMFTVDYAYLAGGYGSDSTTATVAKITQPFHEHAYAYRGGLAAETHNGVRTSYGYDELGQLKRVNDAGRNRTFAYTYDMGGNILGKAEYSYTSGKLKEANLLSKIDYAYGDADWKDMLTGYDGRPIVSDAIGNVLDDGIWKYNWRAGRQLARMDKIGGNGDAIAYTYNADGLRIKKDSKVHGATEYTLSGSKVVHITHGPTDMHFYYGVQGNPVMVSYNGNEYWYLYNLQGDVIGLLDKENNEEVVAYSYDAWGKQISCMGPLAATLGRENPFRYRGYVYDEETGLYYLRSRYYNPEWGRFISMDNILGVRGKLLAHNLFAYCMNEPIGNADPSGHAPMPSIIELALFMQNFLCSKGRNPSAAEIGAY